MVDDDDYPGVRPVVEVVAEMLLIADRCEEEITEDEMTNMVSRALSLVLELRVPRMPDTPEELADLLADVEQEETFTADQSFDMIREHSVIFNGFLDAFRTMVKESHLEEAALCLAPNAMTGAPTWHGETSTLEMALTSNRFIGTIVQGQREQICTSPVRAMCILGVTLRCHALWADIRRR